MRGHSDGTYEVWKYDVASLDLKRDPRKCFRFVCVCIELAANPKTLIGLMVYFKGDQEDVSPKEIAAEVKEARTYN